MPIFSELRAKTGQRLRREMYNNNLLRNKIDILQKKAIRRSLLLDISENLERLQADIDMRLDSDEIEVIDIE